MARTNRMALLMTGFGCLLTVALAAQQSGTQMKKPMQGDMSMPMKHDMDMKKMTKAEKIANALTAAPATITAKAAVYDWPAKDGDAPELLRAGTNGWSCFPDYPAMEGNAPMCLDEVWTTWFQAYLAKKTPQLGKVGVGYMTAPGGEWGSNSDPYATMKTTDNHWAQHPPHLMIAVPDVKTLSGISTDPANGGPYVMWAGTPYAHIMAPVGKSSR